MMNARAIAWLAGGVVAVVAALVLVPLFLSPSSRSPGPSALAGQTAPAFDLLDDSGKPVSLVRYRGDVVIMNLWASWCPPCRAEMPDLQRLADAYRGRGLAIVGVNEGESPQRARAFADSLRIAFPIWIDDQQRYGRAYDALGLPTTVIVGRDGKVVRGFDGALAYSQMRAAVDDLVSAP
ncbi:MAG: TlpA family protein disulfide reductase [Candidatus Eremiobacteraeota bacterium]|nr:TlpA family protein disulfide reductase [Candidatus Eremiobacteraeota bacterium]